MKSFLKEIESKFEFLQEKDWDGDGKQETDEEEYLGVKDKAIQAAMAKDDVDEGHCGCEGPCEGHCNSKHEDVDEAHCNSKHEDLEEMNQTSAIVGYNIPGAFSTKAQAEKKKKMKYESVHAAMDQKYAAMIESYSKFATGNPKSTPSQTVNGTIKEVAKKLQEIEQLVRYTSRLKNESGIAGSSYGKSTHTALNKISERLLKISERIRSLGE